jgi:hypothetical protein
VRLILIGIIQNFSKLSSSVIFDFRDQPMTTQNIYEADQIEAELGQNQVDYRVFRGDFAWGGRA